VVTGGSSIPLKAANAAMRFDADAKIEIRQRKYLNNQALT